MNILHISDIHFSDNISIKDLTQETELIRHEVADWKVSNKSKLEYVFVSGDITKYGQKKKLQIF